MRARISGSGGLLRLLVSCGDSQSIVSGTRGFRVCGVRFLYKPVRIIEVEMIGISTLWFPK